MLALRGEAIQRDNHRYRTYYCGACSPSLNSYYAQSRIWGAPLCSIVSNHMYNCEQELCNYVSKPNYHQ